MSIPLRCPADCADGVVLVAGCDHMGRCGCEPWERECEACLATPGYATCLACGEEPAVDLDEHGDAICGGCSLQAKPKARPAPHVSFAGVR